MVNLFLRMGQIPFHINPKAILMFLNYQKLKVRGGPLLEPCWFCEPFPRYGKLIPYNWPKSLPCQPKGHFDLTSGFLKEFCEENSLMSVWMNFPCDYTFKTEYNNIVLDHVMVSKNCQDITNASVSHSLDNTWMKWHCPRRMWCSQVLAFCLAECRIAYWHCPAFHYEVNQKQIPPSHMKMPKVRDLSQE